MPVVRLPAPPCPQDDAVLEVRAHLPDCPSERYGIRVISKNSAEFLALFFGYLIQTLWVRAGFDLFELQQIADRVVAKFRRGLTSRVTWAPQVSDPSSPV